MAHELLEKELEDLPATSIADVIEYVQFLKYKLSEKKDADNAFVGKRKHSERKIGILQGKFVMSDDFDETPDCFEEYM